MGEPMCWLRGHKGYIFGNWRHRCYSAIQSFYLTISNGSSLNSVRLVGCSAVLCGIEKAGERGGGCFDIASSTRFEYNIQLPSHLQHLTSGDLTASPFVQLGIPESEGSQVFVKFYGRSPARYFSADARPICSSSSTWFYI